MGGTGGERKLGSRQNKESTELHGFPEDQLWLKGNVGKKGPFTYKFPSFVVLLHGEDV